MSLDSRGAGAGNESPTERVATALAAGEKVLAHRFGAPITLVDPEDLAGNGLAVVVRVKVDSSPFALPRTLVIKHYPRCSVEHADRFATEAASYQLFTALSPTDRVCPELIAHDSTDRVLVLEDLGAAPTLEDRLDVGDARVAERTLLSWASTLGRMHATTAGREPDFNALLRRLGGEHESSHSADGAPGQNSQALVELLDTGLGVATSDELLRRHQLARDRLGAREYRAFSPADLSPENNLVTGGGVRFLDFERGCVRNPLIDVAHLRAPFAFWTDALALPPGMSEAMIAAWHTEITAVWPGLAERDALAGHLLDGQLLCVWSQTLSVLPGLLEDPISSGVRRPAAVRWCWLELAKQAQHLGAAAIAEHAGMVADALDTRFGPDLELALYPAFR